MHENFILCMYPNTCYRR